MHTYHIKALKTQSILYVYDPIAMSLGLINMFTFYLISSLKLVVWGNPQVLNIRLKVHVVGIRVSFAYLIAMAVKCATYRYYGNVLVSV